MIGSFQPHLIAASALLVATALLIGGATIRWLRLHDSDSPRPLITLLGRVTAMAAIATLSATALRVAVGLLIGDAGTASGWLWLIRTETVAVVGGFLLIGFVDSQSNRAQLLLGAGSAGVLTWAIGQSVELVQTSTELDPLGVPLLAAVLTAILLSPGPTARLVRRLRYAAAQSSNHYLLVVDESGILLHASDAAIAALQLPTRSSKPFATSQPVPKAFSELIESPNQTTNRLRTSAGRIFETQTTSLAYT